MAFSRPIESEIKIEPYEDIVGRLDYSTPRASRSVSPVCDIENEKIGPAILNGPINSTSRTREVETGVIASAP